VHSGIYGLYTPYAFLKQGVDKKLVLPLVPIQRKYCKMCKVGPASILLKYQSSGTSLDYAYEKLKIPYSYTWEIFDEGEEQLRKIAFLMYKHYKGRIPLGLKEKFGINFLQTSMKSKATSNAITRLDSGKLCFSMFNPLTKTKLKDHTENWVKALKSFFRRFIK
jgi:hypothetical protein